MRRTTQGNINTPELFNKKFQKILQCSGMDRLESMLKLMESPKKFIDVGCFDSPIPIMVKLRYPACDVQALDFAPDVINFWKEHMHNINYYIGNAENLEDDSYDYITAGEIIEHLNEPTSAIDYWMSKLAPGGVLAISTPNNEQGLCVGGLEHVWSFTEDDFKKLGFDTEIVDGSIIAWKKK